MGHQQMQGLGKLSVTYLKKLISKSVIGPDNISYPGASKLELLSVIYLSQIADSSGYISEFKIRELASVIGCSERAIYVIFEGLKKKGYISYNYYDERKWTGLRDIKLIGNDFSKIKKFNKNTRYINTFYNFFDFTVEENCTFLSGLSLYALRLLLLILSSYNYSTGLRMSCDSFCVELGISDRTLIRDYFKELEAYFGENFYSIKKNTNKRLQYGMVYIPSKNNSLRPESTPSDEQLTFYKRKWLLQFNRDNMVLDPHFDVMRYLNEIFNYISAALSHQISLERAESTILDVLYTNHGFVDILALYRAKGMLEALYTI